MKKDDLRHATGFDVGESLDIASLYPRFLLSKHHDVPALLRSELPKYSRRHLVAQASALVPSAAPQDFTIKGRPEPSSAEPRASMACRSSSQLAANFEKS